MNIWPAAFIVFLLAPVLISNQAAQNSNRSPRSTTKLKETKTLFKQHCVKCHGVDGRGQTVDGEIAGAQDFTNKDWQEKVSDERLVNSITYGRGQMPAFAKKLSKEQIQALADFTLAFKP
jgi:mono/diheme cytochrome c family protein